MTYDEAMIEARKGKRVAHPGHNVGWCVRWEGKHTIFEDPAGRPLAGHLDDRDRARTDWYVVEKKP